MMNNMRRMSLLCGSLIFLQKKRYLMSPQPPLSQIIRGQYEDRIRRYSPPQKIFYVFATKDQKGVFLMDIVGLLKSICFYNYSESDEEDVKGFAPQSIFKFLGANDKFQIYDYFNLIRFFTSDEKVLQQWMKMRGLSKLNKQRLKEYLLTVVYKDYSQQIRSSIGMIESRQFKPSKQRYEEVINRQIASILGENYSITAEQLHNLRQKMIKEAYEFQFRMFKSKGGNIDGIDFARSIVKYTQHNKRRRFMKKIKRMAADENISYENIPISMESYIGFHQFMVDNFKLLEERIQKQGALSTDSIKQIINSQLDPLSKVTQQQISIFTTLLDDDGSGFIEKRQFLGVVNKLGYYLNTKTGEIGTLERIKQMFKTAQNKWSRIVQIIEQ